MNASIDAVACVRAACGDSAALQRLLDHAATPECVMLTLLVAVDDAPHPGAVIVSAALWRAAGRNAPERIAAALEQTAPSHDTVIPLLIGDPTTPDADRRRQRIAAAIGESAAAAPCSDDAWVHRCADYPADAAQRWNDLTPQQRTIMVERLSDRPFLCGMLIRSIGGEAWRALDAAVRARLLTQVAAMPQAAALACSVWNAMTDSEREQAWSAACRDARTLEQALAMILADASQSDHRAVAQRMQRMHAPITAWMRFMASGGDPPNDVMAQMLASVEQRPDQVGALFAAIGAQRWPTLDAAQRDRLLTALRRHPAACIDAMAAWDGMQERERDIVIEAACMDAATAAQALARLADRLHAQASTTPEVVGRWITQVMDRVLSTPDTLIVGAAMGAMTGALWRLTPDDRRRTTLQRITADPWGCALMVQRCAAAPHAAIEDGMTLWDGLTDDEALQIVRRVVRADPGDAMRHVPLRVWMRLIQTMEGDADPSPLRAYAAWGRLNHATAHLNAAADASDDRRSRLVAEWESAWRNAVASVDASTATAMMTLDIADALLRVWTMTKGRAAREKIPEDSSMTVLAMIDDSEPWNRARRELVDLVRNGAAWRPWMVRLLPHPTRDPDLVQAWLEMPPQTGIPPHVRLSLTYAARAKRERRLRL